MLEFVAHAGMISLEGELPPSRQLRRSAERILQRQRKIKTSASRRTARTEPGTLRLQSRAELILRSADPGPSGRPS